MAETGRRQGMEKCCGGKTGNRVAGCPSVPVRRFGTCGGILRLCLFQGFQLLLQLFEQLLLARQFLVALLQFLLELLALVVELVQLLLRALGFLVSAGCGRLCRNNGAGNKKQQCKDDEWHEWIPGTKRPAEAGRPF